MVLKSLQIYQLFHLNPWPVGVLLFMAANDDRHHWCLQTFSRRTHAIVLHQHIQASAVNQLDARQLAHAVQTYIHTEMRLASSSRKSLATFASSL